ncbi:MAG: hypothetical protein AB1Z98_29935 [Nannocystaceae bacterium]
MSRASTVLALVMGSTAIPVTAQAGTVPLPLLVKKKKRKNKNAFTPEQAADRRMPVQDQGRQMIEAGELTAATILFDGAARTQGDPVLFLDAADAYLELATTERDIASAETAKLRAQTAQDILYFHRDPEASDPDYRLVTDSEITGLLSRAEILIERADTMVEEIETELEGLEAAEPAPARKPGNGRGLRIAGLGLTGLGVAGLGVGVAGLVIGRINQNRVDDPTVYGSTFDDFDAKGRRGNVIAGVGLAVGGVAIAAGVTMFIIGRNRGERAGSSSESVALVPTGRGVALVGRF